MERTFEELVIRNLLLNIDEDNQSCLRGELDIQGPHKEMVSRSDNTELVCCMRDVPSVAEKGRRLKEEKEFAVHTNKVLITKRNERE